MTVITPPRAQRSPLRLVAGLLWLVAAGLAVGSTFADLLHRTYGQDFRVETGYWEMRTAGLETAAQTETVAQTTYYGIPVILAAVLAAVAFLVLLLSARRWGAAVAGALGTGILLDSTLNWWLGLLTTGPGEEDRSQTEIKAGLILATAAAVVAVVALLLAVLGRDRPVHAMAPHYPPQPPMRPMYPAQPPQPPQPPRWEPETPSYGVPVQTASGPEQPETPSYGTPAQPESAPDAPSDATTSIEPPPAPEPGTISRKLDGDDK